MIYLRCIYVDNAFLKKITYFWLFRVFGATLRLSLVAVPRLLTAVAAACCGAGL